MANRTYLLATDGPFSVMPEGPEIQSRIVAAASYMIPVFWYALFAEDSIAHRTVAGEDGAPVTYPIFQAERDAALARLAAFTQRTQPLFASVPPNLFTAYTTFLSERATAWIAVDTAELWMMDEASHAEASFRRCVRAAAASGLEAAKSANPDWEELLGQANIQLRGAKPIDAVSLFGYAWNGPVPWETPKASQTAAVPKPTVQATVNAPSFPPACPACRKPLLSRQSPLCSFCGVKVPAELLFSPAEKQRIAAEEQKARQRIEEMEFERQQKSQKLWRD